MISCPVDPVKGIFDLLKKFSLSVAKTGRWVGGGGGVKSMMKVS